MSPLTREVVLDALYRPVPVGCCGNCELEEELHGDHPLACMKFIPARACGTCGVRDIPRRLEWPWWRDGKPVHRTCMERRERE